MKLLGKNDDGTYKVAQDMEVVSDRKFLDKSGQEIETPQVEATIHPEYFPLRIITKRNEIIKAQAKLAELEQLQADIIAFEANIKP